MPKITKEEITVPETHVALRTEFIETYHKGRHRAPVDFKLSLQIQGKEYLVSSNGFNIGVPSPILDELKERIGQIYRLTAWEVIEGRLGARASVDFELEDAENICSTLSPAQLEYFLMGESRQELVDLKINRGDNADF